MKKLLLLVSVLSFCLLQAVDFTNPIRDGRTLLPTTSSTATEVPDDIIFQNATKLSGIVDQAEIAPPNTFPTRKEELSQELPQPCWGTDVLVSNVSNPGASGNVTTDNDALNGDMYVSFLCAHSNEFDTVYTYRSQDGGLTWSYFMVQTGNATTGGIRDHEIVVGGDGGGAWIYSMVLYDGAGSYGGIWCLRVRNDLSGAAWNQVVVAGDTISNISVGRNIESPQHLFLCWQSTGLGIDMESSADLGTTWGNHRNVASSARNPNICAGGDAYVYICYQESDTAGIRIGRYTNNLISPTFIFNTVEGGGEGDFYPDIAAGRTTPGASQIAMVLFRHRHSNGNADFHYGYTYDGGVTWATAPWPVTNQTHTPFDFRYPFNRVSYDSPLFRAGGVLYGSYDSLVYAYAQGSDPTTWADRGILNDHDATGEFGPKVGYSADCSGGYVVYRQFGSANIWCDAYDFTGVEESHGKGIGLISLAPNPNQGHARLSYTLSRDGNVRISVYDATGRLAKNLVSGSQKAGTYNVSLGFDLPAGVYVLRMDTPDGTTARTMTVVK